MASVLDLVRHYQKYIEQNIEDEQRLLKCIDKLFRLDVTVQHLQETGVGRTVNALRKEPGDVGHAARALVYKWKCMVAAEESDQEEDQNESTTYNGLGSLKYSDDNSKRLEKCSKSTTSVPQSHKHNNGDYNNGTKRKYHSSEDENDTKKGKYPISAELEHHKAKSNQMRRRKSESESEQSDESESDDSESEVSELSEHDIKPVKIKTEKPDNYETKTASVSHSQIQIKTEPSSSKSYDSSERYTKHHQSTESKHSSDKSSSKEKQHKSHRERSSHDADKSNSSSDKKHKIDHRSSSKHKEHKDLKSSSKHHGMDKHLSSSQKTDSETEKHGSSTHKSDKSTEKDKNKYDKHKSSSHRSEKDKMKSTSEKQIAPDKHKSKESSSSSSSKDKSSSSKEKSKDSSSSSKDKSSSHRSDKKHSSSNEKSKSSDKNTNEKKEKSSEKKSSHKSSSSSQKSKSSSSKSKEDVPKKVSINSEDSGDGIDCGSGASFADVLGMIIPTKSSKKKSTPVKENHGSSFAGNIDTSPVSLLSPSTKLAPLAPLPPLEISALPEISPNYKPRPPPKFLPHFPDDDAMNAVISSKNQRTKVYSGNKTYGKVPTLYEMCIQIIQENIDALEFTGGVPYEILKPVLEKATPEQLFNLEHFNPYLLEDTDVQWQKFCVKNFRNKKRQEMETWREMYLRCQEEQEIKLRSLTANIRIAQEAKKAPIKQTKMAYVDTVVKPPRNIARKQAQHGTAFAATASPAARVSSLAKTSNVLKGSARPQPAPPTSLAALARPKKAPLMQKALQFMRGRKR